MAFSYEVLKMTLVTPVGCVLGLDFFKSQSPYFSNILFIKSRTYGDLNKNNYRFPQQYKNIKHKYPVIYPVI